MLVAFRTDTLQPVRRAPGFSPLAPAACLAALFVLVEPAALEAQKRGQGGGVREQVEREPNDRLPRNLERRVQELTAEGKPDEVADLLANQPKAHRVYVARAFAQASLQTKNAAERERQMARAAQEYREATSLQGDAGWLQGERRRFNVAQWQVELGDLILRRWIAADMDRYEITSGLDFDRERVTHRLRETLNCYAAAGGLLDELSAGLRKDEEKYLLLGVAGKIAPLREQQQLNSGWATLYLAITSGPSSKEYNSLLASALAAFDVASRNTKQADRKYNALLGAGITLYHSKRFAEAVAVFDRITRSTAALPLVARAYFEKARALAQSEQFAEARNELEALKSIPDSRLTGDDAAAAFYVRLAPLIHAQTHLLEARSKGRNNAEERKALEEKGYSGLARISEEGGIWPEIVQVYLDALGGQKRALDELTDVELQIKAERLMAAKDYAAAIPVLRVVLDRPGDEAARMDARFNLGVCLFQKRELRSAAEAFTIMLRAKTASDTTEKAVEYAYYCWRQVAHESQNAEDYRQLAEVCELIRNRFAKHRLAEETEWIGALARQEAGDLVEALAAYQRVPRTSEHYWIARRNAARCKQAAYDAATASSSPPRRRRAAEAAVEAWRSLADDLVAELTAAELKKSSEREPPTSRLSADRPSDSRDGPPLPGLLNASEAKEWTTEARQAAAALSVCDDIRGYAEGLRILAELPLTGRVLALRLRCHRGLGDLKAANEVLEEFIRQSSDAGDLDDKEPASRPGSELDGSATGSSEPAAVLAAIIGLAAEMEKETARLKSIGRPAEAARMAGDTAETIVQLLEWIQKQPAFREHVPAVRYGLVKALAEAKRPAEAVPHVERLITDKPDEGEYVRMAALLQEAVARGGPETASVPAGEGVAGKIAALDKAEAYWARLLKDETLRQQAPDVYWEARYHWLEHQLRHGRAAEVLTAIDTEKAWYPDLGGPPWDAKLLDLANRAGEAARK